MNRALTSHEKIRDHVFPLRKARYKLLQELLEGNSESATKYSMLDPGCAPDYHTETECRKAEWVEFYIQAYNAGVDETTLPDITSCDTLVTSNIALA